MRVLSKLALLFLGAIWMLPSMPANASGFQRMVAEPATENFFYLFQAELLGNPNDVVEARVEYRSGNSILATRVFPLTLGVFEEKLVSFPSPGSFLTDQVEGGPTEVHVFVGDLLLSVLDAAAMDQAAKVLSYRFPDNISLRALRESIQRREAAARTGDSDGNLEALVETISCSIPGACSPGGDYDGDGVINANDNCIDVPNSNQSNCDGDTAGDVCDAVDGIFQATGGVMTCMTDKDHKPWGNNWEHHVEQRQEDVSTCGSPDRWSRWIRAYGVCDFTYGDEDCCINTIGSSIEQVGDDSGDWCRFFRNIDYCH